MTTATKPAKLTKNPDNDGYSYASIDGTTWVIVKGEYWPSSGKKKVYYTATNSAHGITFDTDTLKHMRVRLPVVDEAYFADGTLLTDVSKTLKRMENEKKNRPANVKLAAADKRVVEDLKCRMKSAQFDYDRFVAKVNEGGIEEFATILRWGGSVSRQSYMMKHYRSLLEEEGASTPEGRLMLISNRHHGHHRAVLESSFHDVDSTGDFHRAVLREKNRSIVQFFHVLDALLRIYREEYVESDNLATPISSSTWL